LKGLEAKRPWVGGWEQPALVNNLNQS